MLTLRLFFTLGYLFCLFDGEKTFHFFLSKRSRLCVVSSRRVLECFLTSKQELFEVSEKKLEMNAWKKKSKCICQLWKKSFLKTLGIPFWYPYDARGHHHSLLNLKEPSFLMIQSGRFISDKSNHLKIKLQ